mgnify:FL=1
MNLLLGLISKTGIPGWVFKIIPILAVLGYTGFLYYQVGSKESTITNLNSTIAEKEAAVAGLLIENTGLRNELTIYAKKVEDTATSVANLTNELNTLKLQAQEKLNAIKQYQASDAKRCVLSSEWLRLYKQITTTTDTSESNPPSGSTKSQ